MWVGIFSLFCSDYQSIQAAITKHHRQQIFFFFLRCCWAFVVLHGLSLFVVLGLLIAVASLALGHAGFNGCGAQA